MRQFVYGFIAGAVTYHYVYGGAENKRLVTDMRGVIKSIDDRLAEVEKNDSTHPEPPSTPEDPTREMPTPPPSPPMP